jgi:hypothetical protein
VTVLWRDLTAKERRYVVEAIRHGAQGDLLLPDKSGVVSAARWYEIQIPVRPGIL